MREISPTDGCKRSLAPPWPGAPRTPGFRSAGIRVGLWLLLASGACAQTFNLGPFDFTLQGTLEVGYDSNVDDAYPEEENPKLQKDDFYWMPGLSLKSQPVPLRPSTMITLSLGSAYKDYFERNDLDEETYHARLDFQTVHPRLTLSGGAGTEVTVDANEDVYMPGGASYDPHQIDSADVMLDWNWKHLQLLGSAGYTSERHFFERYEIGDEDETVLMAGARLNDLLTKLDLYITLEETETVFPTQGTEEDETVFNWGALLSLFSWGGLYYDSEETVTKFSPSGEETEEIEREFGLTGEIPIELLRHPHVTYSFGLEYEDNLETTPDEDEDDEKWKPVHTVRVWDEFQISKTVKLSFDLTWDNDVEEDEVGTIYNIRLTQMLGASAQHGFTFSREPEGLFGSTAETETTTYSYDFRFDDFIFSKLALNFGAIYEESTPQVEDALTEETTTITWGLSHTRQLSRKLSRILAYTYKWEDSNFHEYGAMEKHLVTYGLIYDF